jgi:LCP family protein required for cell wall assembly
VAIVAAVAVDAAVLVHRIPTVEVTPPGSRDGTAYLLLASDSRDRLPAGDRERYADRAQATGERADLVLVLRRTAAGEAEVLSIPRDLYVGARAGDPHRLGLALEGGAQTMVTSLCRDLGIGVDHVAILDFRGLIDLVDSTGGVLVSTREPLRDLKAGLSLPRAGRHHLGGEQALAWVRSRQPEVLRDGRWTPLAGADRTRTSHAVDVLEQAAAGLDGPVAAHRALWALGPRLRRDDGLGVRATASLALDLRAAVAAGRVRTAPARSTSTEVPVAFATAETRAALAPFQTPSCTTAPQAPAPQAPAPQAPAP